MRSETQYAGPFVLPNTLTGPLASRTESSPTLNLSLQPQSRLPGIIHAEMSAWTRSEKISVAALIAAVTCAVAAWLVVPEFRRVFRLGDPPNSDRGQGVSEMNRSWDQFKYLGITFQYDRSFVDVWPAVDSHTPVAVLTAKGYWVIVSVLPLPSSSSERETLRDSFLQKLRGGKSGRYALSCRPADGDPTSRWISGNFERGDVLRCPDSTIEIFLFERTGKLVQLTLGYGPDHEEAALKSFAIIGNTFTVQP